MAPRRVAVATVLAVAGLAGCRADFSRYLAAGECDPEGRCADGYRCVAGECVRGAEGSGGSAGGDTAGGDTATGGAPSTAGQGALAGGGGGDSCAAGLVRCGDDCVDLDTAVAHCGACDHACSTAGAASTRCAGGVCQPACDAGRGDCVQPAGAPDDGCETDLTTNDQHCGGCGSPCDQDPVHLTCGAVVPGQCGCATAAQCGEGGLCDESTGVCACKDASCAVGEICPPPIGGGEPSCSCGGGTACTAGFTCCLAAGCRDLGLDPDHCGACGRACPGNAWCNAGACMCRNNTCRQGGGEGTCNTTTGRCTCGGTVCAEGQWCLPGDVCG